VRRLLHVALLLMIILGIRACGGMAVTEDRLGAATRAMADKVGLANKKDAFDAAVRPPMAAATQSLGNSISVTTARTVDSIELAAGSFSGWMVQQVRAGLGLVDGSLQPQPATIPEPATSQERRDREEEERRRVRSQ
jgi:hypothetical protein